VRYARAVDLEDGTLVIGDYSANSYTGSVRIREWNGSSWQLTQTLSGDAVNVSFGTGVALSSGWLAVSAPDHNQGLVRVFKHDGGTWAFDADYETSPGYSLQSAAMSYPWIAVAEVSDAGAARVQMLEHDPGGGTWSKVQTIGLPLDSGFRVHVAVDGDRLAIGLPSADVGANVDCGLVWHYTRSGETWSSGGYFTMSQVDGRYGQYVAVDGDTIASAEHGAYLSSTYSDAIVSVWTHNGAAWNPESVIGSLPWLQPGSQINDIALDGNDMVVVVWNMMLFQFSTHHLHRSSGAWYYQGEISPGEAALGPPRYVAALDQGMVAMDGGSLATERIAWVVPVEDCDATGRADLCEILMPGADGNADSILDRCACPGDLDFDDDRDGSDIVAFLTFWGDETAAGDLNGDGSVDVEDLLTILSHWGECP